MMDNPGTYTRQEILSQPAAWEQTFAQVQSQVGSLLSFYRSAACDYAIFTGCGSTYYLSLAAAATFQELTGIPARALPASELWLYPRLAYPARGRILLSAFSRSGETSETLQACRAFQNDSRGNLVTYSCSADSPLAGLGHLNLVFPAGMENSYVQTRAFTSLFLAALAVMTLWSGREDLFSQLGQLPGVAGRLLDHHSPSAARLGRDLQFDRFYFLGSGPRYGLACELSLKMKEMSLTHSEPFHFMEFRHGPKTMLTGSTLLVGLVSQASHENERAVLEEMRREGASILDLGESDTIIPFHSGLDEAVRNVLYLPIGQLIALERALAKQIDPDRPHNLDAVVKLEI